MKNRKTYTARELMRAPKNVRSRVLRAAAEAAAARKDYEPGGALDGFEVFDDDGEPETLS